MELEFFLLIFSLTLVQGQFQCKNSYQCQENPFLIDVSSQLDSIECLKSCQALDHCQWYTYYPDLLENNCKLFQDCQFESYCRSCITGQASCPAVHCDLQGLCQGQFLQVYEGLNKIQCSQECLKEDSCTWYSFNFANQECLLFQTCPSLDESQMDQVSNPVDCARLPLKNKLVIATGSPADDSVTTEIIDLSTPYKSCKDWPDFPIQVYGASGSLINEQEMVICGGNTVGVIDAKVTDCFKLGSEERKPIGELELSRYEGASLSIPNGLWIMGGSSKRLTNETEMIFLNGTSLPGPELPNHVWLHCVTFIDSSRAMLIAGQQGDDTYPNSARTFIYDFVTGQWSNGTDLILGRSDHACGTFYSSFHGSNIVAAIGGFTNEYRLTNSTELMKVEEWGQLNSTDLQWMQGPDLPLDLCCMAAVTNPTGDGLLIVGGDSNAEGFEARIHELTCAFSTGCSWKTLNQVMKVPRYRHLAFITYENENITCT